MTTDLSRHFREHQQVVDASVKALEPAADAAGRAIVAALAAGQKVICFGNGGSAAEASHMAEELVGRYSKTRRPFPAISLAADSGTVTCIANDFGYGALFERQIEAFAQPGDVAIALTTSGGSENVIRALTMARAKGAVTIALTGSAGLAGGEADHLLAVPSGVTAYVQEVHLMLLHVWCTSIDKVFATD